MSTSSGSGILPKSGDIVSLNAPIPAYIIKIATKSPHIPSIFIPNFILTSTHINTTVVATESLKLSIAVAFIVTESIFFPIPVL